MEDLEQITIEELIKNASIYIDDKSHLEVIKQAYEFAKKIHEGEYRLNGDEYINHSLSVAFILTKVHSDYKTLAAAILHDVIRMDDVSYEELEKNFDKEIATLVKEVTKINKLSLSADSEYQINYYKKVLIGLCEDVRVLIIKLADRLHNMTTLWAIPENKRKQKSKETLEILAPIAHRLGIHYLKSELEDLSLRYYKPDVYYDIVTRLNNTKKERDSVLLDMKNNISDLLNEHGIKHEIKFRSKSIYSIYNKMQNGKKFEEIYDILALRIYVEKEEECYLALGLIHSKYKPVPKRYKDYISMPKENLYQSLHTTIYGIGNNAYEVQIRTYDMDKIAEYGIASHWAYKEHLSDESKINNIIEQKLQKFRDIIETTSDEIKIEDLENIIKKETQEKLIYVYTPKGDVIELPYGSTPIDFAYKVHSGIGDKMVCAIVNESIVPLDYKLKDQDVVKINVNKNSRGPSREWINLVYTSQARNKIKSFYTKIDKIENIKRGQELLEKELRKNKIPFSILSKENIEILLETLNESNMDDIYLCIGNSKYTPSVVINILNKEIKTKEEIILDKVTSNNVSVNIKKDIIVSGIDEIKVTLANCCKPVKGDDIIGYITRGNGIVVHRNNCHNIANQDDRIIQVEWNENSINKYPTSILVKAEKASKFLANIISKASTSNINIKNINVINNIDFQTYDLLILVENLDKLQSFLNDIYQMKEVIEVERLIR
jgi:GTP pyrophosphokinase